MTHTAKERIYVDKDGNVVAADDPNAAFLAVGEGQELSDAEAKKYGVKAEAKAESKAEHAPAEDKAEAGPNKSGSGLTINRSAAAAAEKK